LWHFPLQLSTELRGNWEVEGYGDIWSFVGRKGSEKVKKGQKRSKMGGNS
jgi:hypothetical protein